PSSGDQSRSSETLDVVVGQAHYQMIRSVFRLPAKEDEAMKTTGNMGHSAGNPMIPGRARASSAAAVGAVIGGALWALTPLRQPIFNAGGHPSEGELFFRGYNAVGLIIVVLLTFALFQLGREGSRPRSWTFQVGWWIVLAGNAAMIVGSVPAIVLGGQAEALVEAGQDAGFLGAILAALGAILLGIAGLRHRRMPKPVCSIVYRRTSSWASCQHHPGECRGARGLSRSAVDRPLWKCMDMAWCFLVKGITATGTASIWPPWIHSVERRFRTVRMVWPLPSDVASIAVLF
ncbi:MAG TPA: hypothetical protein VHH13_04865, partial [Arthrobacter sp.]|nr:hypothetical protein [Arthrobacter sp.]